jgi:hypothetical protein
MASPFTDAQLKKAAEALASTANANGLTAPRRALPVLAKRVPDESRDTLLALLLETVKRLQSEGICHRYDVIIRFEDATLVSNWQPTGDGG